jgi:hypothetical protein
MTISTVSIVALQATGQPLPNGSVTLQLTAMDIVGGMVAPEPVVVSLDANGLGSCSLIANASGTQGTQYLVTFVDQYGVPQWNGKATIPATATCNLHDVLNLTPPPALSDAQAAQVAAQGYAAAASGSASAAATSANTATAVLSDSGFIAVKNDLPNIDAVVGDKTNIDTVATNIASVNSAATNMAAIIAAPTQAAAAAASRTQMLYIVQGAFAPGTPPTHRDDGSAIQNGDYAFFTDNLFRRYNGATWVASDINTANLAAGTGATMIGYGTGTVKSALDGAAATYARPVVGIAPSPLADRAKSTAQADLALLHRQVWKDLGEGVLQSRKAAYAASAQFPGTTGATQKIPDYAALVNGSGDNTTITADAAIFTAVTAVYNLTLDPGRATNKLQTFYRNSQQVVMTVGPTAGDTIEVVGTVLPYQGRWASDPPTSPSAVYFEVIDFDDSVCSTSNGTGGAAIASPMAYTPLASKLPLPTSGAVTSNSYINDSVVLAPNYATPGADPRGQAQRDTAERNSIVNHDSSSASYGRFRKGFRFYIAGTAQTRGVAQTVPQTMVYVNPLGGASGGWPSKHLNVIHALVRVVDSLTADAVKYPIGRVFLMVASRTQTGVGGQAGTASGGASAVDLFALPVTLDHYEGMVTL